jgi:hypothetical protein
MMSYNGLNTRNKKGVKMKMKTTISFYGKGIEIVFQCAFHKCRCMHVLSWTMHVVPYLRRSNRL